MLSLLSISPVLFVIAAVTLVIAITVHEFAHALAADKLGDPTPRLQKRLTLNPLAHLDPLGTLFLFFFGFGWGKPVQFDPYNLQNPRRDAAIISFAGPFSNMVLVTLVSLTYRLLIQGPFESLPLSILIGNFIRMNLNLAIFNLLPIHPLDGGKILVGLLPGHDAARVNRFLNQYGVFLLLIFIFFPIFGGRTIIDAILTPIVNFLMGIYLPSRHLVMGY